MTWLWGVLLVSVVSLAQAEMVDSVIVSCETGTYTGACVNWTIPVEAKRADAEVKP